ncbi:MAG TPA: hypothetical protein VGC90_04815, partial [Candidatus Limnocylindrales bacterium]
MEPLLLGVDGGNTKTIALVAQRDGTVVGAARVLGCGDIHGTTVELAMAVVERAIDEAIAAAAASS